MSSWVHPYFSGRSTGQALQTQLDGLGILAPLHLHIYFFTALLADSVGYASNFIHILIENEMGEAICASQACTPGARSLHEKRVAEEVKTLAGVKAVSHAAAPHSVGCAAPRVHLSVGSRAQAS